MIKAIVKLISALNGNASTKQLAAGFAWGILLGLIPAGNFFWIVLFLASFFFRHNHASKLLSMVVVKIFSPIIIISLDAFGWYILHIESLKPLFTTLYNMPFVPFTKFNNTLVMGGLAGGIILWLPIFFLFLLLIPLYRKYIAAKIRNSKIVQKILKFPLFSMIDKALAKK